MLAERSPLLFPKYDLDEGICDHWRSDLQEKNIEFLGSSTN